MGKGFTLIEILISFFIITVLLGFISFGIDFYRRQELENQANNIVQTLRRAQSKAISGESDSSFGVYLTENNYTIFKGDSYQKRDSQYDEVFELPGFIILQDTPKEVVFSKFEGRPSLVGNIILKMDDEVRTININKMGKINLE